MTAATVPLTVALLASGIWVGVLVAPWRSWSTRERLDAPAIPPSPRSLAAVTALVPARDEAALIERAVRCLRAQGDEMRVVVIDDRSSDGTAEVARRAGEGSCEIVHGAPLPDGWVGKLWALEQGRQRARTPLVLLVDADIELCPGIVQALLAQRDAGGYALVSLMAMLDMRTGWDKLLVPAFVYFFKLLYPFRLSNGPTSLVAAAAGGCVLIEAAALDRMGGFGAIRSALIDDCALARRVKRDGGRTWIGLTHSVVSRRPLGTLAAIWNMVARSAFAQLRYSTALLVACVAALALAFWAPVAGVIVGSGAVRLVSIVALAAMAASYAPVLRFYTRSPLWALALPVTGTLYLLMTVSSAVRVWRGTGVRWKGRAYHR